jgi:hypothetical protein
MMIRQRAVNIRAPKKYVTKIRSISVPYFGVRMLSYSLCRNTIAIRRPVAGNPDAEGGKSVRRKSLRQFQVTFSRVGQSIPTSEGLRRSFAAFRTPFDSASVAKPEPPMARPCPSEASSGELQHNPQEFVVGAALGPDSNGSFDHLLAASSNLRNTGRPTRMIVFASHDTQRRAIKAAIQEFRPDLQWVPNELNTRDSLQACDVLVSLQDGVPLLVLQAMSSRIPIITTAVRVPEALRDQRSVVFIRDGDEKGLQEALLKLSEQSKRSKVWSWFQRDHREIL